MGCSGAATILHPAYRKIEPLPLARLAIPSVAAFARMRAGEKWRAGRARVLAKAATGALVIPGVAAFARMRAGGKVASWLRWRFLA